MAHECFILLRLVTVQPMCKTFRSDEFLVPGLRKCLVTCSFKKKNLKILIRSLNFCSRPTRNFCDSRSGSGIFCNVSALTAVNKHEHKAGFPHHDLQRVPVRAIVRVLRNPTSANHPGLTARWQQPELRKQVAALQKHSPNYTPVSPALVSASAFLNVRNSVEGSGGPIRWRFVLALLFPFHYGLQLFTVCACLPIKALIQIS